MTNTEAEILAQFGEAGFERDGGQGRPWSPQDNSTIEVGVLGPIGALRTDPRGWRRFHKVHWGFEMTKRNGGDKLKFCFYCVEEKRNGMITRECAMCNKITSQKDSRDAYEADLKRQGKSIEDQRGLLAPFNNWLRRYNCEKKWWMFAMNPSGQFNRFKLSYRTFQDFEKVVDETRNRYKLNPLSPTNLIMWNVTRIGSGKNPGSMTEKVEPTPMEKVVNGQTYWQPKAVSLSTEQLLKAYAEYERLGSLDSIKGAIQITPDQIRQLAECNEDPDVVAAIVNVPQKNDTQARTQQSAPVQAAAAPAPAPVPTLAPGPISVQTIETVTVAPASAPPQAPPQAVSTTPSISTTTLAPPAASSVPAQQMTEAEIFAKLGINPQDLQAKTA